MVSLGQAPQAHGSCITNLEVDKKQMSNDKTDLEVNKIKPQVKSLAHFNAILLNY